MLTLNNIKAYTYHTFIPIIKNAKFIFAERTIQKMKRLKNKSEQSLYKLDLITSELNIILSRHPNQISKTELIWIETALPQILDSLQNIVKDKEHRNLILVMLNNSQQIQKYLWNKKITLSNNSLTIFEKIKDLAKTSMQLFSN